MKRLTILTLLLLGGCAQIVGIEDRKVAAADGGTPPTPVAEGGLASSPECDEYCTLSTQLCTKDNGGELFYTKEGCQGACFHYPRGDLANRAAAVNTNSLACRLNQLRNVMQLGEPQNTCPGAGPGGGPAEEGDVSSACGTNCEGYCTLYNSVCDNQIADCMNKCKALSERPPPSVTATADFMSGDDTLQCRLAHLAVAAGAKFIGNQQARKDHCDHSGLKSSSPCDLGKLPVTCKPFCRLVQNACAGPLAVYDNEQQCLQVCEALESGTAMDTTKDNRRCRRENAYAALINTVTRNVSCSNAGPVPAACGAGKCSAYCALAKKGCPEAYAMKFNNDDNACLADCGQLPDRAQDSLYASSTAAENKRSLHCRVVHLVRHFGGETNPMNCAAALNLPGNVCQ